MSELIEGYTPYEALCLFLNVLQQQSKDETEEGFGREKRIGRSLFEDVLLRGQIYAQSDPRKGRFRPESIENDGELETEFWKRPQIAGMGPRIQRMLGLARAICDVCSSIDFIFSTNALSGKRVDALRQRT